MQIQKSSFNKAYTSFCRFRTVNCHVLRDSVTHTGSHPRPHTLLLSNAIHAEENNLAEQDEGQDAPHDKLSNSSAFAISSMTMIDHLLLLLVELLLEYNEVI